MLGNLIIIIVRLANLFWLKIGRENTEVRYVFIFVLELNTDSVDEMKLFNLSLFIYLVHLLELISAPGAVLMPDF